MAMADSVRPLPRPSPERITEIREALAERNPIVAVLPLDTGRELLAEVDALQADYESEQKLISFLLFFVNKETIKAIVEGTAKHFAGHTFVHPETGDRWDVVAQRHEGKTPIEIASVLKGALVLLEAELRPFADSAASVASYEEAFELMAHWHKVAKTALDPARALDEATAKELGWEVPPAAPIPVALSGVREADVPLDAPEPTALEKERDELVILLESARAERDKAEASLRELRPSVLAFARRMEDKLRQNDHKGGWSDTMADDLIRRLKEETKELVDIGEATIMAAFFRHAERPDIPTHKTQKADLIGDEAADIANFAMMIADNAGALK